MLDAGGVAMTLGLLATLAVPYTRKKMWGINGNGHFDKDAFRTEIFTTLETNHFHVVNEKLEKHHDILQEIRDHSRDTAKTLERIEKNVCVVK